MTKHHIKRKERGWQRGVVVNGIGAVLSFIVLLIVAVTKFEEGAWADPRHRPDPRRPAPPPAQAVREGSRPPRGRRQAAATAPVLRRHVVLVFVARLDPSTARAIQYARTLMPDELRAVHIAWDRQAAEELADGWRRLGLSRVPLELVDCPDRRVAAPRSTSWPARSPTARPR